MFLKNYIMKTTFALYITVGIFVQMVSSYSVENIKLAGNETEDEEIGSYSISRAIEPYRIAVYTHNKERAKYHNKKLTWSNTLASQARALNHVCEFKHKSKLGENLYWTSEKLNSGKAFKKAVKSWATEKKAMDNQGGGLIRSYYSSSRWGHYTQIIWGQTTQIGCSKCRIHHGHRRGTVVRCLYYPAGNVLGQRVY